MEMHLRSIRAFLIHSELLYEIIPRFYHSNILDIDEISFGFWDYEMYWHKKTTTANLAKANLHNKQTGDSFQIR